MGVLLPHGRDLCFLNTELLSRQMSLRLICLIQLAGLLQTGWAGCASCSHVLLNQAQFVPLALCI